MDDPLLLLKHLHCQVLHRLHYEGLEMDWKRKNPSSVTRKVWEAELTVKQEFRKSGQEQTVQSAGESQDKGTLRTQEWGIHLGGHLGSEGWKDTS